MQTRIPLTKAEGWETAQPVTMGRKVSGWRVRHLPPGNLPGMENIAQLGVAVVEPTVVRVSRSCAHESRRAAGPCVVCYACKGAACHPMSAA